MEPVLTDVALDHKPAHVVGLPADTVQRGRRHLPSVPKQRRNEAGRGGETRARPETPERDTEEPEDRQSHL